MDAISDPTIREVWVQKSSQVGWTEILGNAVAYFMSQDPSPQLMVQPTLEMAEAWSKDRFAPMLRDTPALRGCVGDARARDSGNTLLRKEYPGGHIAIAGANSAASLASRPVRIVLCDEIDRYPVSAGTEGDPIKLAQKRSNNFWNRRFLAGSTPTIKGASRIEIGYESSDKRRFFVPCPHCGAMQALEWKRVRWPEGRPEEARYTCAHCDGTWNDTQRNAAVRRGEWRATAPFKGIAGFHVWEAYSPWRRLAEIATDFLAAKPHPELLKVWVNTSLGETWEDPSSGERMIAAELSERAGAYEPWTAPAGAILVASGTDVQHDRLEVGVYAFGPGEECWTVAHDVIYGAPKDPDTWLQHDELIARLVHRLDGLALPISASGIDASDGTTTGFVLDYCRARRQRKVIAIKGSSLSGKPPIGKPTKVDVNIRGRVIPKGAELWPVGTDTIKGVLMARLQDEGFVHFPEGLGASYFEQLTAERLVTKFKNGVAYKQWSIAKGARNEALDCFVYAYAAACYAGLKRANWKAIAKRLQPWRGEIEAPPVQPDRRPQVLVTHEQQPMPKPRKQRVGLGTSDWNM